MGLGEEHYVPIMLLHGQNNLLLQSWLPDVLYIPLNCIDSGGVWKFTSGKLGMFLWGAVWDGTKHLTVKKRRSTNGSAAYILTTRTSMCVVTLGHRRGRNQTVSLPQSVGA